MTPYSIRSASHGQAGISLDLSSVWASERLEPRVLALSRTTFELQQLCSDRRVKARSIQDLLASWVVATEPNSGKLQPNLLAWLDDSQALQYAIKNQRKDIMQLLFNYGLIPTQTVISASLEYVRDSRDMSTLELLIDGGWDINCDVNQARPSIMRYVSS